MTRRELMHRLAVATAAFASWRPQTYRPVGYLAVGMPLACRVSSVTVDGVEYLHHKVTHGNDREGWIECFSHDADGRYIPDYSTGRLQKEIRRGVVRFQFKELA